MSCGTCGIQASNTMQEDTGVPAGAPQTQRPRCPACKAFVSQEGATCNNPRCPGLRGGAGPMTGAAATLPTSQGMAVTVVPPPVQRVQIDDSYMFYHPDTPPEVVWVLEEYYYKDERLHIIYGDQDTGRAWGQAEHNYDGADSTGYIQCGAGPVKVPLTVYNRRGQVGDAILTHDVVRIETAKGKRVLYQHPHFHDDEWFADDQTGALPGSGLALRTPWVYQADRLSGLPGAPSAFQGATYAVLFGDGSALAVKQDAATGTVTSEWATVKPDFTPPKEAEWSGYNALDYELRQHVGAQAARRVPARPTPTNGGPAARPVPPKVQIGGSYMYYHPDTPPAVVRVLEACRNTPERVRIIYGDQDTGRAWGDPEYNYDGSAATGYIHSSTGPVKVPLTVYNQRAEGGEAVLAHCVVRIETTRGRRVLYQHPHFHHDKDVTAAQTGDGPASGEPAATP